MLFRSREVKELIHQNVEAAKDRRRMRATEVLGKDGGVEYCDGDDLDFIPDEDCCAED